jgi:hypothetical protein
MNGDHARTLCLSQLVNVYEANKHAKLESLTKYLRVYKIQLPEIVCDRYITAYGDKLYHTCPAPYLMLNLFRYIGVGI